MFLEKEILPDGTTTMGGGGRYETDEKETIFLSQSNE